jgi:gliding motility-associated protein GldE
MIVVLLIISALVSASEIAYFSLNSAVLTNLKQSADSRDKSILDLLKNQKKLLATLLIANNFVNISIVVISYYVTFNQFSFETTSLIGYFIQTIAVTLLIILFGEIIPKTYATQYSLETARFMAKPLEIMSKLFQPFSYLLVSFSKNFDSRLKRSNANVSLNDLNTAIDIAYEVDEDVQEKDLLKGILNFGNISVKEIQITRHEVIAVDIELNNDELQLTIKESGYSRMPVYKETLDQIVGIIYVKDLITNHNNETFTWQSIIRSPFFVPEKKKIDDLFRDFQIKHTHMAIVVDEYGGFSGIVTLEDVLEEVLGEINDEFDELETLYQRVDENTWIFEAKTQIKDFARALEIDSSMFDEVKGEADSLGGLLLELSGAIPKINDVITFSNFLFIVTKANNRKISEIKVINNQEINEQDIL